MLTNILHLLLLTILSIYQITFLQATNKEHTDGDKFINVWEVWKNKYSKFYFPTSEQHVRSVWMSNFQEISLHNGRYVKGLELYLQELNTFADGSPTELEELLQEPVNIALFHRELEPKRFIDTKVPPFLNWANEGWILPDQTDVKRHQQQFGWVTSALRSIEAQFYNLTGCHIELSRQEIWDCAAAGDKRTRIPLDAFFYISKNGVTFESMYPLSNQQITKCQSNDQQTTVFVTEFNLIQPENEWMLKIAVALVGPISVNIKATGNFFFYHSGIFYDNLCAHEETRTNHAVLLVGYGTDPQRGDYWIIQNSWGQQWGENGFARIARSTMITCGIASAAIYPVI